MTGKKKLGRPFKENEGKGSMEKISFRVDAETRSALDALRPTVGADVKGWQSVLIRRLILDELERRKRRS